MSDLASFAVVKADEIVVGSLSGEIDLSNARELESQIENAVPNTALGMVLDLSELRYLDSSGIRLLLSLAGRLRWRGQELVLAAPPESRCRRVLSLAGIESTVLLEATVDAARARLQDPSGVGPSS
jgi:anti-anti-sigma factor